MFSRTAQQIDLEFRRDDPELPTRFFEVEWNGVWYVPEHQVLDLYAGADDLCPFGSMMSPSSSVTLRRARTSRPLYRSRSVPDSIVCRCGTDRTAAATD